LVSSVFVGNGVRYAKIPKDHACGQFAIFYFTAN